MSEEAAWSEDIVYLAEMFHDIYEVLRGVRRRVAVPHLSST